MFEKLVRPSKVGQRNALVSDDEVGRSPMRNHEVDAKGKAVGGSAAANGAAASKRRKRRSLGCGGQDPGCSGELRNR